MTVKISTFRWFIIIVFGIMVRTNLRGVSSIIGCLRLATMKTREAFLENESHQIRIVYTPKHSSWLNQIEIWFGILSGKVLGGRASFKSVQELEEKILNFIEYYNENLAKPFKGASKK